MTIAITLSIACASTLPHLKDVTELAPPQQVRFAAHNGEIKISWEASPHENQPQFAGYNLYYAKKSLILAPIKQLPTPILLEKVQHEFTLANLDSHATYFGHIRSRNKKGDISLPSLPELLIHAPTSF